MEGRFPHGVRLVLTNCTDPSRTQEFNRWYDQVHLPDILGAGVATHGLRYQNVDSQPGEAAYLAIYEIEREDLDTVDRAFAHVAQRLTQQGRMHAALEIARRAVWQRIGSEFSTQKTSEVKPAGIWLIESTCVDAKRESEFNNWYNATHIPDLLKTGLFTTGYRFASLKTDPVTSYLAIYETAVDPVAAVEEFVRAHRPRLRAAGRLSDLIRVTWRGTFRRHFPNV